MRAIRSAAVVLIAAFFTVTYAASGWCQAYPNRTIQLIVAYAAGGTGDIVARSISDKLGAALGQSVVVENRAGASGAIGAHSVTTAAPDGYTLLVGQTGEIAVNQHWLKGLNYDPDKDLVPIALAAVVPLALVVPSKAPYSTLPDFLTALESEAEDDLCVRRYRHAGSLRGRAAQAEVRRKSDPCALQGRGTRAQRPDRQSRRFLFPGISGSGAACEGGHPQDVWPSRRPSARRRRPMSRPSPR